MSSIEKGFGEPKKPSAQEVAKEGSTGPENEPTGFDLRGDSSANGANKDAGKQRFELGSPGRPTSYGRDGMDGHDEFERRHSQDAHVIRREPLRTNPAPYLQAVNEAYHPVIEAEQEDAIDLARYWRIVNRHKWGILSITLLVLVIGTLNALSKTPIYRAQTTLVAEPFQRKVTVKDEYINSAAVFLFYDTQFDIIRSRAIAERAADDLRLVEKARANYENAQDKAEEPKTGVALLIDTVAGWFDWRHWVSDSVEAQEVVAPPTDEQLREGVISEVQGGTSVQGGKQSQIINIYFEHSDPNEAARRANAVASAYVRYGVDTRLASSQRTNQWLQDQIIEVRGALKKSEDALLAYQSQTGLVDTNQQQEISNDRLRELTTTLIEVKSRSAEAKLRYQRAQQLELEGADPDTMATILQSNNVKQLALELTRIERDMGELKSRVTEQHPLMKKANVELDEARKALRKEFNKVLNSLESEAQVAAAKTREIQDLIDAEKTEIGNSTGDTLELIRLERDVENNRKLYEALLIRLQETDVTSDLDTSNIQILDAASAPKAPYKPNKTRMIMLSAILGLGLGVLLAFVREHLDRTLKTMDDIEEKLGLTALGMVPLVRDRKHNEPASEYLGKPRSPFAEKINHIRTGLLFSSIDNPPRSVLVTSATGGEGKTTLAINLAAAYSQLDKTLLLEVDLRKPAISERLGIDHKLGLTDLIVDPGLGDQLIRPLKEGSNLYVLTCGTRPQNPLETLSSQQFAHLLKQLRRYFRYIVLDGPPLLAVSDAAVLGHLVDTTVLVAKAETTSLKMIKDALSLMRKARLEPLGVVLSQADTKRMAYYGGHYYHYDKRYYGEERDAQKAAT